MRCEEYVCVVKEYKGKTRRVRCGDDVRRAEITRGGHTRVRAKVETTRERVRS
jgi:hypothetical protein